MATVLGVAGEVAVSVDVDGIPVVYLVDEADPAAFVPLVVGENVLAGRGSPDCQPNHRCSPSLSNHQQAVVCANTQTDLSVRWLMMTTARTGCTPRARVRQRR